MLGSLTPDRCPHTLSWLHRVPKSHLLDSDRVLLFPIRALWPEAAPHPSAQAWHTPPWGGASWGWSWSGQSGPHA